MFADLAVAVKEIGALDPATMADEELSEAVVEMARLRSALEAAEVALTASWDSRRVWSADGARSGAAWLATKTREPKGDCGRRLWLGRKLAELPAAAAAWAAGDIGAAHVRRLAQAHNRRTAALLRRDEAALVHHARTLSFSGFAQVLDYWSLYADPDGAEQNDIDRRDRRRVSLDQTLGGMYAGTMLLDPISGAIVEAELQRLDRRLFDADRAEAKARLGRDPHSHELARSADQRRADALVEMARRSATAEGKAAKPLFSLLVGSDAFSHLCQLASGQVLAPESLLPWISEADLERLLFDGEGSRVIEVSRKRSFTGALRRLIEVRDRLCYHEFCDEPAHRCQADHILPWSQGGMTAQWNGRLACGFHNRLRQRRRGPPPRE